MITACLLKILIRGTCLVVQWLGLCASTSENMGLIPGWGTKIPHAPWHSQKKKKKGNYDEEDLRNLYGCNHCIIHCNC